MSAKEPTRNPSSSRQLNPFFFSLLSLPGGFLSTGVSFCPQRVDSSSQWEHLPASKPPNVPKPPPTGTIIPLTSHPESRFLQPVGESARWQLTQRPKTSTHWNNHPAYKPSRVQIPPASGRIRPLAAHSKSRNRHSLEQSPRWQAAQRPNPSSDWEDCPAGTGILEA